MVKYEMTYKSVCDDLDISESTLSNWIKKSKFSYVALNYFRKKFGREDFYSIFFE